MVYLAGFIGLIAGFVAGQGVLYVLLRNRAREELLSDSSLKWTYGVLNWIIAFAFSYLAMTLYKYYFIP